MGAIADAVSHCDLADVADGLGLHPLGERRRFCPACQPGGGKTPDLSIRDGPDKARWTCFRCSLHGDAVDLVRLVFGCDLKDAARRLQAIAGGRPVDSFSRPAIQHVNRVALSPETVGRVLGDFLARCAPVADTPSAAYWAGRGIPVETLDAVGIRHCDAGRYSSIHVAMMQAHGMDAMTAAGLAPMSKRTGRCYPLAWQYAERGVLFCVLPYAESGRLVALKLRPLCGKEQAEAMGVPRFLATAKETGLFNRDCLATAKTVLVCEGESDTLTALACGQAAVGIPGASAFKPEWAPLFRGLDVILAFDADEKGRKGLAHVCRCFADADLPAPRAIELPEGMDLSDYLSAPDPAALSEPVERLARGVSSQCCR